MRDLIQNMLLWLATFFGVSLALVCTVRWGLKRYRQQRVERLKEIETRCREVPDELGLPLIWRTSPATVDAVGYRWALMMKWALPAGLLAAGAMWSATGREGWNWNGLAIGSGLALVFFLVISVWMNWWRETTMPRQSRQLALALRCWAIRLSAGIECRLALEQTAKQMRRVDPEIARHLEAAALAKPEDELLKRAFYPCGSGVADKLTVIVSGQYTDPAQGLLILAEQLERFYLNRVLSRTRYLEAWLKYPVVLCLVPAVNLILFAPAVADLFEKFGTVRFPGAAHAPLQPGVGNVDPQSQFSDK